MPPAALKLEMVLFWHRLNWGLSMWGAHVPLEGGGAVSVFSIPSFSISFLHPHPQKNQRRYNAFCLTKMDGQKKTHYEILLVSFMVHSLYITGGHQLPQRLMGFKSSSQLKTKQDKSKHRAVSVFLKKQPQLSREINNPKTTAGSEGGVRRLGKARAYTLGRFLKRPFVYIPIIPGDKMLSAIKGMLPWLLHAN